MSNPAVKPIPEGMHTITPHLVCKGASDAIEFYKKAFNAVEYMRLPTPDGTVMHAMLGIGDSTLMLAEEFPNCGEHFFGRIVMHKVAGARFHDELGIGDELGETMAVGERSNIILGAPDDAGGDGNLSSYGR